MMFLRKLSQQETQPMDENKPIVKLTKKQKMKQKKLERKEQMLEKKRELMKEYLQRELKYGLYTQKKHEASWRRMLTQITLPYHREQLEYTWQTFERIMDAKDFIISCLMDEIREQEDQYLRSIVMQVARVDRMVSIFHEQLQESHDSFISHLDLLKNKHNEFLNYMNISTEASMDHIKSMSYGMEIEEKIRERNLRADLCSKVDYEIDDKEGATLELKEKLVSTFQDTLKNTEGVVDIILKRTRERQSEYDLFKSAEDKAQEVLAHEVKKIRHLNEIIRKLKKKVDNIGHNELANLQGEVKFFKRAFLVLKQKLSVDLKLDKGKIEFFIGEFYEAYENINKFLKRGENMVQILQCTRKLETLDEKIRPYPVIRHAVEHAKHRMYFLFWQRVGKANASRTALLEEKDSLIFENNLLRKKIEEMCSCLSCPRLPPICKREGPIPFTDGVTIMRKYEALREIKRR